MENITEYNDLVFANHFRAAIKLLVVPLNKELYRVRILYEKDVSTFYHSCTYILTADSDLCSDH